MTSIEVANFDEFGPIGPEFSELVQSRLSIAIGVIEQEWKLNVEELFAKYPHRDQMLFAILFHTVENLGLIGGYLEKRWDEFANLFTPRLLPIESLFESEQDRRHYVKIVNMIVGIRTTGCVPDTLASLSTICFGPYRQDEIEYIADQHTDVFEIGAGSGYLAACLCEKGVDVLAVDNNRYKMFERRDNFGWIPALWDAERLKEGSIDAIDVEVALSRTLLVSWPEPGMSFASDAVRHYRSLGGKFLLLKLGSLGGQVRSSNPNFLGADISADGFWKLLDELIENWIEVDTGKRPEFMLSEGTNNLLCFELKR